MNTASSPQIGWRWFALITTIAGVVYNNIYAAGDRLGRITDRYESLFVPAGYAFSIWGLIYLAVTIYLVYSLTHKQKQVTAHARLAILLSLLAVGGIGWITAYVNFQLGLSVLIIAAMLIVSGMALKAVDVVVRQNIGSRLMYIPFGLYAGWLTVAAISNISLWLKSTGWMQNSLPEPVWALIMLIVAAALGIAVAIRWRNITYTLVICWATLAIWVKQTNETVAGFAMAVAVMLFLFAVLYVRADKK